MNDESRQMFDFIFSDKCLFRSFYSFSFMSIAILDERRSNLGNRSRDSEARWLTKRTNNVRFIGSPDTGPNKGKGPNKMAAKWTRPVLIRLEPRPYKTLKVRIHDEN